MTAPVRQAFLLGYAYAVGYIYGRCARLAEDGGFREDEHPRDKGGRFTKSSESGRPEDISGLWGKAHTGVRGDDAIRLLMKEQNGHVKAAFHRADIGSIDLIWGDENIGLCHIIKRRSEEDARAKRTGGNSNVARVLSGLTETVEKGKLRVNRAGNFEIWYNGNLAVVYPAFKNNRVAFVCTAYKQREPSWLRRA